MKQFRIFLIVAIMALALTACNGKPKYVDDTTYKLGIKALETMDAYNNMEVDKDEAYKTLDEIYNRLDDITFSEKESSEEIKNGLVKAYVLNYQVAMTSGNGLFEAADKLRETLNK